MSLCPVSPTEPSPVQDERCRRGGQPPPTRKLVRQLSLSLWHPPPQGTSSSLAPMLVHSTKRSAERWRGGKKQHQLLIGAHSAALLLIQNCANCNRVADEWDTDEASVREAVDCLLGLATTVVRHSCHQALPSLLAILITVPMSLPRC